MSGVIPVDIKLKILAVREVVPCVSNNDIVLVLQYYENDVDRATQAFLENGAKEALAQWNFSGNKNKFNIKRKKRNKCMEIGNRDKDVNNVVYTKLSCTEAKPLKEPVSSNLSLSNSKGERHKSENKDHGGLDKSRKDLQRMMTSLGRQINMVPEGCKKAQKQISKSFEELHDLLSEREAQLLLKLDQVKMEATEILMRRQTHGMELKIHIDRVSTMKDFELSQLRTEIKNFVSERKIDEDIANHHKCKLDIATLKNAIQDFGEVPHLKGYHKTRQTFSIGSSVDFQVSDEAYATENYKRLHTSQHIKTIGAKVVSQSESLTTFEINDGTKVIQQNRREQLYQKQKSSDDNSHKLDRQVEKYGTNSVRRSKQEALESWDKILNLTESTTVGINHSEGRQSRNARRRQRQRERQKETKEQSKEGPVKANKSNSSVMNKHRREKRSLSADHSHACSKNSQRSRVAGNKSRQDILKYYTSYPDLENKEVIREQISLCSAENMEVTSVTKLEDEKRDKYNIETIKKVNLYNGQVSRNKPDDGKLAKHSRISNSPDNIRHCDYEKGFLCDKIINEDEEDRRNKPSNTELECVMFDNKNKVAVRNSNIEEHYYDADDEVDGTNKLRLEEHKYDAEDIFPTFDGEDRQHTFQLPQRKVMFKNSDWCVEYNQDSLTLEVGGNDKTKYSGKALNKPRKFNIDDARCVKSELSVESNSISGVDGKLIKCHRWGSDAVDNY